MSDQNLLEKATSLITGQHALAPGTLGGGRPMSMTDVFHSMGLNMPPVKDEEDPRFLRVIGAALGGFQLQPKPDDFTDQMRIYRNSALIYRCAQLWAESIMQAKVRILRVRDGRIIEEVRTGDIWEVLREINGLISFHEWMYAQILNLALTGNSYTWKVRDRMGNVVELWPFRPDEMEIAYDPVIDPRSKLRYEWRPITTGGTASMGIGGPFFFRKENILHLKLPSPVSQVFGTGPVRAAHDDIVADQRSKRSTLAFLENEGVPAGVLQTDAILTEDQARIIKQRWSDAHIGPDRTGKIAVLGAGTKFTPIAVTPKDVEWLNQRKLSRAGILMAFGVPPIYAGMEGENFANRKEQRLLFWQDTIRPKLRLLEAQLSEFLLRDFDPELRWKFDETKIDAFMEQLAGRVKAAVQAASPNQRVLRPFEARKWLLGLDLFEEEGRFPGDDEFLVPANMIPATDALTGQAPAGPVQAVDEVDEETLQADLEGVSEEDQEKLKKFERFGRRERQATERFGRTLGRFFKNIGNIVENRLMRDREPTDLLSMSEIDRVVPNSAELERSLFDASQRDINNAFGLGWQEGIEDIEEEIERDTSAE